jgi:amino acid transporter
MPIGSAAGFMLVAQIVSFMAIFVLSVIFTIGSVGLFFQPTSSFFLGLALPGNVPGANPTDQVIIGGIIFVALIILNTVAPKASYKFESAMVLIGIGSLIAAVGLLLSAGQPGIVNYMASLGNANMTYNALASSYSGPTFNLGNSMMMLPWFFIFIFPWFNGSTITGSELKGKNAARWSPLASAVLAFLLTLGTFATLYYVAGMPFINGAFSNPTAVFTYGVSFWTMAMGVSNNTALAWMLGICWIIWNISVLNSAIIVWPRYVFAQALDRWLPSKLAEPSRFGSPMNANIVVLVVGVALVAATAFFYGPLSVLISLALGAMVFFVFVGVGAVLYGARQEKGRTKTILMVAGTLMSIVFIYAAYLYAVLPGIYGGGPFQYAFLIVSCLLGIVLYYAYRAYYKSRGLDISLIYKQIPPL